MTKNAAFIEPPVIAPAVALRDVRKVHGQGDGAVVALDGVSVGLSRGSFTAIMGPSGSGKSTFLHVAAGLDRPTSGTVALGDTELAGLSERRLTILRRERIGFVFQAFNLMPSLTVTQNIGLPLRLDGRRPRRSEVREVAARVGLDERLRHRPSQLSGGQQQRVAIARALVTRPEVVFADEPTGALDTRTGRGVLALLREVVDADGHTVVMVTHDPVAAAHADRVILLADGRIAGMLDAPERRRGRRAARAPGELSHASSRPPQRPRPPRHLHRRPRGADRLVRARDGRRHAARGGAAHPSARRALRRRRGRRDRAADRRRGPRRPARRARPRGLRARRPAGGRPRRPGGDRRRVGAGPPRRPGHRRPRLEQRRADALRAERRTRARRARRGRHRLPRRARRAAAPRVHRSRPHRHRGRRRPARATPSGSRRRSS